MVICSGQGNITQVTYQVLMLEKAVTTGITNPWVNKRGKVRKTVHLIKLINQLISLQSQCGKFLFS